MSSYEIYRSLCLFDILSKIYSRFPFHSRICKELYNSTNFFKVTFYSVSDAVSIYFQCCWFCCDRRLTVNCATAVGHIRKLPDVSMGGCSSLSGRLLLHIPNWSECIYRRLIKVHRIHRNMFLYYTKTFLNVFIYSFIFCSWIRNKYLYLLATIFFSSISAKLPYISIQYTIYCSLWEGSARVFYFIVCSCLTIHT